jgi:RNA polymerase sigma-70 factor, ECF subfamily
VTSSEKSCPPDGRPIPFQLPRAAVEAGSAGRPEPAATPAAMTSDRQAASQLPQPADQVEIWSYVARAQRGDGEAFGLIYARYSFTIFKFINARVKHIPTAEDLTSDTFLRAFRRIGHVQWQGRDLAAWLLTIARNVVTDHFKSRRRSEVTLPVFEFECPEPGPEGAPDSMVANHLINIALITAVTKLTPPQRRCIELRFLGELSTAETAQAMGKTKGAVKALQCRAVRALGELLSDDFEGALA